MNKTNDSSEFSFNIVNKRYLGDLDQLNPIYSNLKPNNIISEIKSLKIFNQDYLLSHKLFSEVITEELSAKNEEYKAAYKFQQTFLKIFKDFFSKFLKEGKNKGESEKKTAKIIWNYIQKHELKNIFNVLIEPEFKPFLNEKFYYFLEKFNVASNLVDLVKYYTLTEEQPLFIQIIDILNEAENAYSLGNFQDSLRLLKQIITILEKVDSSNFLADFLVLIGKLFQCNQTTSIEAIKIFKKALDLYETSKNFPEISKIHSLLAETYWQNGNYKKTLDHLSSEIDLYYQSNEHFYIMNAEEQLSNFFYNLSRFSESQEWSLKYLNSAIRATEGKLKGFHFLEANLNYARTLTGLNAWNKAEEHLSFAERSLIHLKIPELQQNLLKLEIFQLKGHIAVYRGRLNEARYLFDRKNELNLNSLEVTPSYSRFLREEATLYRNLNEFSHAIHVLQPLFRTKDSINPINVALLAEILALHSHESQALKLVQRAEQVLMEWNSIHGLSHIYLSKGYIFLLMQDFDNASKSYYNALEIVKSDLADLKIKVEANLHLSQIAIQKGNLKLADHHCKIAEESALMSGSLAFQYNTLLMKIQLTIEQGNHFEGLNELRNILIELKNHEIWFLINKAEFLLKEYS
ncbi:tetratricopeptide repeat protein [Candidatus Hodarchaeum mangrovi]